MNVVHFSRTPLAGSPIRIVKALNRHTAVSARLVVGNTRHYGERSYEGDLDWQVEADRDTASKAIADADVLHLHRYMNLDEKPFGVDFHALMKRGKRVIRQFHTHPGVISGSRGYSIRDIVNDPLPQLVLAQYHERYFPRARPVPNVVPLDDPRYQPAERADSGPPRVFFAPTMKVGAWDARWETKGAPETVRLLKWVAHRCPGVTLDVATGVSHDECLERRQRAQVCIDELVTGSYHLSSLESLAQGAATFAFLDQRTRDVVMELTGTRTVPWMNFRLEDAEPALCRVVKDADLCRQIGMFSRKWMERYWSEPLMAGHYQRVYEDLLQRPEVFRKVRFDENNRRTMWFVRDAYDVEWEARRARQRGYAARVKQKLGRLAARGGNS